MLSSSLEHADPRSDDLATLQDLNQNYVRAAATSDVHWYAEHLAEDFLSSNPDGSLVDRAGFLARMARPYPGSDLTAVDVGIRMLGDIAIIHAGFRYTKPNGEAGAGRYTDVWARRQARWLCVAAHFTRN